MLNYETVNLNPKGKRTPDCVTRALANVLGISWEEALTEQYQMALKTGYALNCKQLENRILKAHGYVKQKQPRKEDGSKYLVRELDELVDCRSYPIYVTMAGHATCIRNGAIQDIWNCGYKTIGNYWIKEGTKRLVPMPINKKAYETYEKHFEEEPVPKKKVRIL